MIRVIIQIIGTVQGVGFRPFIYNLAVRFRLKGYIINNTKGVEIDIEGDDDNIKEFEKLIYNHPKSECKQSPPLSERVISDKRYLEKPAGYTEFKIIESVVTGYRDVAITPDIATCCHCYSELIDIDDRRYKYPFINCSNCGARFTILKDLPYDRQNTTMDKFKMCANCQSEYENPHSPRFHTQGNTCGDCGPYLSLYGKTEGFMGERNKALTLAIELIKSGAIISIKGIGGFHLCCDALNDRSVKLLRDRKNRPLKPFAVMFKDMESIKKYVIPSIIEQAMIESKERPVTIIDKIGSTDLSKYVAPCLKKLGVFLPYSPLHHLICNVPLVMTSANLSGQAIVKDNEEALLKLYNLSDYILIHNRDIKNHCDDSVITSINQRPLLIRRSRGYAIKPIKLPIRLNKKILALGGQQKSVIALGIDDKAIASQYIGELDDISTCERFDEVVNNLMSMYNFVPELIVHDKHLGYYSTKWAKSHDIPSIGIQHHYAHALSVMADNGQSERDEIMAVTWDGTGYGDDGNIWGGEFLLSNYRGYKRIYHFDYFRLIGGDKAIKEPKRVALSLLFHIYGKDALEMNLPCIKMYAEIEKETLFKAWERGINSPLCSSVGRIFDGVASLLNIVQELGYQGQAGMMMEDMYDKMVKEYYPYEVKDGKIFWQGFIVAMIEDKSRVELRVTRFINTLAQIVIEIAKEFGKPIGLSGGVFQNKVLTEKIIELGGEQGITVLTHKNVPANDGGLFLGQLNGDI